MGVSKIGKTVRNSAAIQPNLHGQMTRSWTRHISSAGGGMPNLDLPYPGHLPTLGLLKRKKHQLTNVINEYDNVSQMPPRHLNQQKSRRRGYDFYENS